MTVTNDKSTSQGSSQHHCKLLFKKMKISSSILSVLASGVPINNFDSSFQFRGNQFYFEHLLSAAKQIEGFYIIDNARSANIQFGFDSSIFTILGSFSLIALL